MADDKIADAQSTGAEIIDRVRTSAACSIWPAVSARGHPLRARHIAEILAGDRTRRQWAENELRSTQFPGSRTGRAERSTTEARARRASRPISGMDASYAAARYGDFEALREQGRAIRDFAIAQSRYAAGTIRTQCDITRRPCALGAQRGRGAVDHLRNPPRMRCADRASRASRW